MSGVYTFEELKNALSPIFLRYGVQKAVLFGSYGKGTAGDQSDVDILVESGLRGLSFMGFLDDVKTTVGKDVDLFDVTHIEPGSLIENEIRRTGVLLYEK